MGLNRVRIRKFRSLRKTEIQDLRLTFSRQHDVAWLEIAMKDVSIVRGFQAFAVQLFEQALSLMDTR